MRHIIAIIRLALFLTLAGFYFGTPTAMARDTDKAKTIETIRLADLPPEARQTLVLIKQGGPFPYLRKDGSIFGNYESRLPERSRGYYREYTVPTPGSRDRGARRIIAGASRTGSVATSGEYYFTADHYRTFRRIQEKP